MLEQVNLPDILPAPDITDDEYLTGAEGEIRGYGRLVVSGIIAIGKKLSEVRTRVGHGKYGEFIKRLGFSHSTAQNFVQSYELLTKFANFVNLASLQIDATALYLLARPSTSDEVRTVALEKAATEGISHAEVQQLIAEVKAEAERKTKEAADAEAAEKLAAVERASEEAARTTANQTAALAEQNRQSEVKIAQALQRIVELEAAAATVAQTVRAEVEAQYAGKIIIEEDELSTQVKAATEASTAPLDKEIAALKEQIAALDQQVRDRAGIRRKQAEAMIVETEKAKAEAKEALLPAVDKKLLFKAMKARHAILHCVGEIELSPAECIAVEVDVATGLLARPDIARDNLGEVAAAVQLLSPWFEKFTELYETEIGRDDTSSAVAGVPLAAPAVEPTGSPPTSLEMPERSASPAATLQRYQSEQDPPPKRGRGRPLGSRDTRPRKAKNTLPPTGAELSPDFAGKSEIETAQLQTHDSESSEAEMRNI